MDRNRSAEIELIEIRGSMDSLSQIVLGASVAELTVGKKVGNKAILWGAIAGTIPDLDVISNLWLDEFTAMASHRGFTHSILFCFLAAPLLGKAIAALYRSREASWWHWTIMSFWCFATHIALDCCTTWGTMVFWPLDIRVTTNSVFVADPLYTLPFLGFVIAAMCFRRRNKTRRVLNYTGLVLSTAYLAVGLVNQVNVHEVFRESLAKQGIPAERHVVRPMPLNIWLWMGTAEVEDGYYVGYYSVFDQDTDIAYRFFDKQHELLAAYRDDEKVKRMIHMSEGYYVVRDFQDSLQFNDLRFGVFSGWNPEGAEDFVFQYTLTEANGQLEVDPLEPPNPSWEESKSMLSLFYERIRGNKQAAIDESISLGR